MKKVLAVYSVTRSEFAMLAAELESENFGLGNETARMGQRQIYCSGSLAVAAIGHVEYGTNDVKLHVYNPDGNPLGKFMEIRRSQPDDLPELSS